MADGSSPHLLSADRPEQEPDHDLLGYAPFARYLASCIAQMTPPDGLVLAVYGPWGAGKSTLLNFVLYYLRQMPDDERPAEFFFNPWWFSGQDEDLTTGYFRQFLGMLEGQPRYEPLRQAVSRYAEAVGAIRPTPPASGRKSAASAEGRRFLDVAAVKREVGLALQQADLRFLVLVDDIDRLTAEEIRQLFRLVRAIADFPNMVYLLAFDKTVARQAVESVQGVDGLAYLEKIVQVPFELPLPDSSALEQMLFDRLQPVLYHEEDENSLLDMSYWSNIYFDGVRHFIRTPRDVVRLVNTLSVTYRAVHGEANPADFIAIEALRVFHPAVYEIIRSNPTMFAGDAVPEAEQAEFVSFHSQWMQRLDSLTQERLKRLLARLFPKLEEAWGSAYASEEPFESWRLAGRIASPEVFPVFFRLAVPRNDLTNLQIQEGFALAASPRAFGSWLLRLQETHRPDGTSMARRFLERLLDYDHKDIPVQRIPGMLQALCEIGDILQVNEQPTRLSLDFGITRHIHRVFAFLLRQFDEPQRYAILRQAFSKGDALYTIADLMAATSGEHGKFGNKRPAPEAERTVSVEHLKDLETLVASRMRDGLRNERLPRHTFLRWLLAYWTAWASEAEPRAWLVNATATDDGLLTVLENFVMQTRTEGENAAPHYRLDPNWFRPYIAPETLVPRVRDLYKRSYLSAMQRIAVERFLTDMEARTKV